MERVIDVAQYIFDEYKRQSGEIIDEMRLHKLLYLVQRESLAITNEQLFPEAFEGWKYGPVSKEVRAFYTVDGMYCRDKKPLSAAGTYIVKNVILQYGSLASWKLSEISHKEVSWMNSRRNLAGGDNGNRPLLIDDIRKDAEKVRPYDSMYDMYYDEFEEAAYSYIGQADESDMPVRDYPLLSLSHTSYIRTHKQSVANGGELSDRIIDFRNEYPDEYIDVMALVEEFQRNLVSNAF